MVSTGGVLPSRRSVLLSAAAALASRADALAASPSDGAPGRNTFRDEVVALLRTHFPDVDVVLDEDPEQIRIGRFTFYLGNLQKTVAGLRGAERQSQILKVVGDYAAPRPRSTGPAESFVQAASRLRLQIVPNEYLEQAPTLVSRRISDRLHAAYALDEANRYQLVTQSIFEGWGVDQAKVERIASDNLEQASAGVEIHISPTGKRGHFATIADETGYSAARLLLPVVMHQVREGLRTSAMVVAVPTRDILIAWDPDSDGRDRLARIVTQTMQKGPYGRSAELFHFSADGLRPLSFGELVRHGR